MSTTTLVVIAVLTAFLAVAALWFMRWQEQKRLERARLAVAHSDAMGDMLVIGDSLQAWLSPTPMRYLADSIRHHQVQLELLKVAPDQRINRAIEAANQWANHAPAAKAPLPAQPKQAQDLRNLLQRLIEIIRTDYQQHKIAAEQARPLLAEAKQLNVRLAVAVFESKAAAAATLSNHSQNIHYLRKALAALKSAGPLSEELTAIEQQLNERLQQALQIQQQNSAGTRLEAGAELLAEEDDSWKKKHF